MQDETGISATNGRRVDGTFAPGHRFSRGNKGNKRVAELRAALLDAVEPDALSRVVRKLLALAESGDVPAAKVILEYSLGRPPQAVELSGPDGGPLGGDWDAFRGAILDALQAFPEAKLAVALHLRKLASEARTESEEG